LSFIAIASDKDVLKSEAKSEEVSSELQEPDGVSIKFLADGGWKIWARGSGVYDFNDEDDRQDALQEAVLKAKANISKYLKEKLTTEQSYDNISKKMKKASKNGTQVTKTVSKEVIKTIAQSIKIKSESILKGVLILETLKIPSKSGEGGKINATLGISSKSISMSNRIRNDISSNKAYNKKKKNKANSKDKKEKKKSKTDW